MKLPYMPYHIGQSPLSSSGVFYRPEAPLFLPGRATVKYYSALVDTGADHCIVPKRLATLLGISLDGLEQVSTRGFTGDTLTASVAATDLQVTDGLQTFQWTAPVAFVAFDDPDDEMVILGHVGCLEYFRTTFDGQAHEVDLVPTPAFPGSVT